MHATAADLSLLASAVAGRHAVVHVAPGSDPVRQAYADGQVIVLPAAAAGDDEAWLHIVSQALLMGAGSLHPAVLRRLLARPAAAQRYAWLEVCRAAQLLRDRLPPRYASHLSMGSEPLPGGSPHGSATQALSGDAIGHIPGFIGTVRPWAVLRRAVGRDGMAGLRSPAEAQHTTARHVPPAQPARELSDEERAEDSTLLRLFSNPFTGRGAMAGLLNQLLGAGAQRGGQAPADGAEADEMPIGRVQQAARRGAQAVRAQAGHAEVPALHEPDPAHESPGHVYPEWDGHAGRYRAEWVCVAEVDAWHPDGPGRLGARPGLPGLHAALQPPSPTLQRALARLPLDAQMHRRQRDGAEFDLGRLVDHAIARHTGDASDRPDVYRASRRTRRDLGVVVVVDASGSTEECNPHGERVFDQQASTAWRIARTLDHLGDRVALYGFQSWGRRRVHMVRLKGHEEAWSGRVAERLAQLDAVGYTRTGAAVRHAEHLLRTQIRLPHRLMVLITDGLAYDSDYQGTYAEHDTRRALAEARAQGTACVCLCIGGSVEAGTLARVFGEANLLQVEDGQQVDARLRAVCARALAGVSRRRPAALATLLAPPRGLSLSTRAVSALSALSPLWSISPP